MQKRVILSLLIGGLLLAATPTQRASSDIKPRIAFLPFVPESIEATSLMDTIPTLLTMAVSKTGYFEIVEKKKVERGLELEGYRVSSVKMDELFKVCSKLGFDFSVIGSVQKQGGVITAIIKVVDIRAQKICLEDTIVTPEGGLNDRINNLSTIISQRARECFSTGVGKIETVERTIEPPPDLRVAGGGRKIKITWSYRDPQNIIGFKVFRAKNEDGAYMVIGTVSGTTFTDETPPLNEPLFYRVKTISKNGIESAFSKTVEASAVAGPPAPIFLNIELDIKTAYLKWRAHPGSRAASFRVYRKDISEKEFKEITSLPSESTAYTDKGLKDDATYQYALTSIESRENESDYSRILEAKTPKAPEGLKAESGKIRRVPLSWNRHPSNSVEGYRIYRAVEKNADYKPIGRTKERTVTNYTDPEGLLDLAIYWYKVAAYNKEGLETDLSEGVSATTRGKPPVPRGLTAKDRELRKVSLRWEPVKSEADEIRGYYIFRSLEEKGSYGNIGKTTGADKGSFTDNDPPLNDHTTYYYKIASYNSVGVNSDLSEHVSSTTKKPPEIPKGLKATSREVKQVTLIWEANLEKDIKHYTIFRADSDSKDYKETTSVKGKISYINTGLKDGMKYAYTIQAVDEDGLASAKSGPVTASTKPLPTKPTGLRASEKDGQTVSQWNVNPERDIKQYIVYKKGFLGISQKMATVQNNSWTITERKEKLELFVTAVDESELESEASDIILIEKK